MLQITIQGIELWDEQTQEFIYVKPQTLQLEHSLVSLSKWESRWHKPFLTKTPMTREESIDYIRCMTITQNVKPETYLAISDSNMREVLAYIENPMTATKFYSQQKGGPQEQTTSEKIYYWMTVHNIPFECQKWHLNRLMTLIRVCDEKSKPAQKMSKSELFRRNTNLNAARRKALNSKG